MTESYILAIDGSTKSTGFAVFKGKNLEKVWHKTSASADLVRRIKVMRDEMREAIKQYNITTVVMEEVRPDRGATNPATMKALMWLQAAFAIMVHDEFPKTKIVYIYPSEWRAACGIHTGRGIKRDTLKEADMDFVARNYAQVANDDEADAVCIGHAYITKNTNNWE